MKTLKIAVRVKKSWWRFNVLSHRKIPHPRMLETYWKPSE